MAQVAQHCCCRVAGLAALVEVAQVAPVRDDAPAQVVEVGVDDLDCDTEHP
ncbi:MAG: hypothetical protein R6W77_01120 [Trueperaceae bacterium]